MFKNPLGLLRAIKINKKYLFLFFLLIGTILFAAKNASAQETCDRWGGQHVCRPIGTTGFCAREFIITWEGVDYYRYHFLSYDSDFTYNHGGCVPIEGGNGVWFWEEFFSDECGECAAGGTGSTSPNEFNGIVYASDTGMNRWSRNCVAPYTGIDVECLSDVTCHIWGDPNDWHCGDGIYFNASREAIGTTQVELYKSSAYDACKWYIFDYDAGGAATGESGSGCIAAFNLPLGDWKRGINFYMMKCDPKACNFDSATVQDNDISNGINDVWCTANELQKCRFVRSGVNTVNGQLNPSFWDGAMCGAEEFSRLYGEKAVYVDNVDDYTIRGRVNIDDESRVFIQNVGNPDASIDAGSGVGTGDACTTISADQAGSNCNDAWVRYNVNLPTNGYYIMNVYLKHDVGCTTNGDLTYQFGFSDGVNEDTYSHLAKKNDDSWEWATVYIGYRNAGSYTFRFALTNDCSSPDLNAYIADTTIHGVAVKAVNFIRETTSLHGSCCGYSHPSSDPTTWANITGDFQTGWNIIHFMADDTCSGDRYFDFDLDVQDRVCDCGVCIPCGCGLKVVSADSLPLAEENDSQDLAEGQGFLKALFSSLWGSNQMMASVAGWGEKIIHIILQLF